MYSYATSGLLVLIVSVVHNEAVTFKKVYESIRGSEGVNFPFTRLMRKGEQLNHANFLDLYYCAINHGKHPGVLGGKTGNLTKSGVPTATDTRIVVKLCKHSSLGLELSDANLARWIQIAEDLGATVSDQDIKRIKRKLRKNRSDSEDKEDEPPSFPWQRTHS